MTSMTKLYIGLAVALALTGGTLAMASQSLPGNPLYGVKLGLLEGIESNFAGEGEARAKFQLKLAERRLDEAARSAAKERFDVDAQQQVLLNFNAQMKGIEEYIATLEAEGKKAEIKDIAVQVGQKLAAKAQILTSTQSQIKTSVNAAAQDTLDFLMLRVGGTLAAAANIAASTMIEDAPPTGADAPTPTDDYGRPIEIKAEAGATGSVQVEN